MLHWKINRGRGNCKYKQYLESRSNPLLLPKRYLCNCTPLCCSYQLQLDTSTWTPSENVTSLSLVHWSTEIITQNDPLLHLSFVQPQLSVLRHMWALFQFQVLTRTVKCVERKPHSNLDVNSTFRSYFPPISWAVHKRALAVIIQAIVLLTDSRLQEESRPSRRLRIPMDVGQLSDPQTMEKRIYRLRGEPLLVRLHTTLIYMIP